MSFSPRVARPRATDRLCLLRGALLGCLAVGFVGCAAFPPLALDSERSAPSFGAVAEIEPKGPGAVFETVEEAALDALAYCYLESRRRVSSARSVRGGAIHPLENGFSYAEPSVARDFVGDQIRYRLRPTDVAHYRHFPNRMAPRSAGQRDLLSRKDRAVVDRRDPLKRPLYYLTPSRFVRVYPGLDAGEVTLARVDFGVRRGDRQLVLRMPLELTSLPPDLPAR